ncbi:MAG: hypothetical protein AAF741_13210 [Bacteroidota bacterium]
MEHDYDIRFNQPEPDSKKIADYRDFEALLAQHQGEKSQAAKRLRFKPVYWAVAASLALLISAFFLLRQNTSSYPSSEAYFASLPYINPPVDHAALPPHQVMSTQESYIEEALLQNNEQRLLVSRMRLANEYNAQPVELHHRTMDDVADFFLSGIPLGYDSLGQQRQLDVTAIVDLFATAGGQRISLATDSDYDLEMSTTISAGSDGSMPLFFLYQLDTTNRTWEYIADVPAQELEDIQDPAEELPLVQDRQRLARDYATRISELEDRPLNTSLPPQPPLQTAQGQPTLTLDFLNGMALAEGSNVSTEELEALNGGSDWQIAPESPAINTNAFNVEWQEVRLRHLSEDRYELTLINPNKEERLIVRPIWFDLEKLAERQAKYENELAEYEASISGALEQRKTDLDELRRQRDAALDAADRAIASYLASLSEEEQAKLKARRVKFELELDELGTFAIARSFITQSPNRSLKVVDENGNTIEGKTLFSTDGNTNSIYRSFLGNQVDIPSPDIKTLWLIDESGDLQIGTYEATKNRISTKRVGPLTNDLSELMRLFE